MEPRQTTRPEKKRKRGNLPHDDGSDDFDEQQAPASTKGKSIDSDPEFACPYYKRYPAKYGSQMPCFGTGWHNIRRMKEHLYRVHTQPKHCQRCCTIFLDDAALASHMLEDPSCRVMLERHVDGLDEAQISIFEDRTVFRKMSENNKWTMIYRILFPEVTEDQIPSPYFEPMPDSSEDISRSMERNLQCLVREGLEGKLATIEEDVTREGLRGTSHQARREMSDSRSPGRQAAIPVGAGDQNAPPSSSENDLLQIVRDTLQWSDIYQGVHIDNDSAPLPAQIEISVDVWDNYEILPFLKPEAEIGSAWIVSPTTEEVHLVKYRPCYTPGSYVRADLLRNHNINFGENGLVTLQWYLDGFMDNSQIVTHTVFRIIEQAKARSMGMDVDLFIGTDCYSDVENQAFSLRPAHRASRRLADSIEGYSESSWTRQGLRQTEPSSFHLEMIRSGLEHERCELPKAKEDDAPYTDSGYESVRGIGHRPIHKDKLEKADQMESGNLYTTSDMDGDDANTSYSESSTALPRAAADETVMDICNHINQRLEGLFDSQTLISASKRLPTLIKAFAVKLGSDMPGHLNFRIMHFVHAHHQYIVSQLQKKFHCDEHNAMGFRKPMDAMSLGEIMSLWGKNYNQDPTPVDPSDYFQGIEDKEDVLNLETDISAFSEYKKTIVESSAYEWLISSLANEASFHWDEAQPRTMVDQIRQGILSQLPTGRISSRRPPDHHMVSFKIPKSSLPFLSEDRGTQSTTNPPLIIADRLVVTSASNYSVQVSKVSQYMDQTWPLGGSTLLTLLQNVINGTGKARASSVKDNNCEIEITLEGFYIEAFVNGTSYSIAEYGEQLAWLTAALQPAVSDLAMYVRPFIRRVNNHTPTRGDKHSWVIEVWREEIDDADVTARSIQEWQGESRSPVIVRGFPTRSRPGHCPGIEVPPQLPASLLRSPSREGNETRLLLNMTGKVLQLFDQTKGVAIWHILGSSGEICACRRRFLKDNDQEPLPFLDSSKLWQHRHIITECSVAELHYRDAVPQIELGIGSADIHQRECSLSEAQPFTPYSENATDSSDSLDVEMLSIPDSSEYCTGGPPDTDVTIMEVVASRLVSEYRQFTEQNNSPNKCPSNTKQCGPGRQQSFPTHESSHSTLGFTTTQAGSTNAVRKRPAKQDDDDGDEDSQRTPAQKKQKIDDSIKGPQFFACPFWKQNPGKYSNCFGKKLSMISRVKQHLTRSHSPEFYCEKCLVVFPDEEGKLTHFREELYLCTFQRSRPLEGITNEQQRKLSRKSDRSLSEYEKWFVVWDIVFPGHDRPSSPYLDLELSRDLNHFREFSERRGAAVLVEVMREEGLMTLEGDDADLMAQRAANRAMRLLFYEWVGHRAESSRNSGSGESSSTDAMGEQQYQGQQHERLQRLADLSSNADSGVELMSYPSSGPSRDGANIPPYTPIQPRLTSDHGPQIAPPALNNSGDATISGPSIGANQPQLFNEPVPVETAHVDTATQSGENHFDHQSLNTGFGTEWAEDLNLGFDMNDFFIEPDVSGFSSS